MRPSTGLLAVIATCVSFTPAGAQARQPWSAQGSVLLTTQDFGDPVGSVGGVGAEAQVRRTFPRWSVGAGLQYSKHSSGGDDLGLTGFFVEPRLVLSFSAGRFAPYLAGRVAYLHGNFSSEVIDGDGSAGGTAFGVGAGLIYGLTRTVNFDIGGAVLRQSLGEITVDSPTPQPVKFPSFTGYVLKAGFSIGFESSDRSERRATRR